MICLNVSTSISIEQHRDKMAKTIIITQKQLDEICGGNTSYLDGLALNPDKAEDYSDKITADGAVEKGYADPTTTDQYAADSTKNWPAGAKLYGMGPVIVREMKKSEWERAIKEDAAHGNKRLNNIKFGERGRSYAAANQAAYRKRNAEKKLNSQNPVERQQGLNTLSKMDQSGLNKFDAMKKVDNIIQSTKPEGEKIASAPKTYGNKGAHSKKNPNGIFLN